MSSPFHDKLVKSYDALFYGEGFVVDSHLEQGVANLGYFTSDTKSHAEACAQLVDQMMSMANATGGRVLDVACGMGGTTRRLIRYFAEDHIHGINLSAKQLEECRRHLPAAHFDCMPAEKMSFPDASFDMVVSIEAAMHFKGRREFLSESLRVLKPGGQLIVADMPFHAEPESFPAVLAGQELYDSVEDYLNLWRACGFDEIAVRDVSKPVWRGFVQHTRNTALNYRLTGQISPDVFQRMLRMADKIDKLPVLAYLLTAARKPMEASR